MVDRRVRHEHRPAQLEQNWRLDHLNMSPQMLNSRTAIAIPPATRERLELEIERFAIRCLITFAKPMQKSLERIFKCRVYFDGLFQIKCHFFQIHFYLLQYVSRE